MTGTNRGDDAPELPESDTGIPQTQLDALEREAAALRAELASVKEQLQAAHRLADRYRGEAESLRTSTTWRVATALKSGVRNPRRLPRALRDVTAMLRGRG